MTVGRLAQRVETGIASGFDTYIGTDGVVLGVLDSYDETRMAALELGTLAPVDPSRAGALYDTAILDGFGKRSVVSDLVQAKLRGDPEGVVAAAVLDSGPVPQVRLALPLPGQRAAGETVDASIELTDAG